MSASYTLVELPVISLEAAILPLPSDIAAGWSGTCTVASNTVKVTFASTPEPGSAMLLATGGYLLGTRRRRNQ